MEIPRTIFTKEKANYWRFMSLVFDIGGDVLRGMLSEYWKKAGSTLELFLGTTYTKLQMQILLNKDIITQNQYDLLYPANSVPPDIKLFDISLLFTLLRNLHPKLKTGDPVWTGPNDSDLRREADIRRVTDFRNRVVHSHTASMSDVDFVANWTSLETVLHRLVQNHPIETDIKQRILALKTASHSLNTEPTIDRMTDCEELIHSAIEQETSKPSQGLTLAHWAAFSGRVDLMKMLVDNKDRYGVDIEQLTHDGKNSMHIACEGGHDEMFFYLFKEFPDMLHEADNSGRFPWHWAAYGGNLHLIKSFCKMKRACNINLLSTDYNGRNVIFYAALGGQGTIFTFLRDTFPQLLKGTDDCGFTIGHYAVYGREVKIMETLLQAKEENAFDLNARSDSGMSLLHTACLGGSLSMFELLASHGDQNLFDRTDDEGKSVAHWAATGGNVSIMKYLQRNHADSLTSLTGSGQTILHEACAAGKAEMFDYILSIHPDMLNASDDGGNTAAHWVAFGGNVDLMKTLSDMHDNKKVDILRKTDSGESILHKACASGKIAMFHFVRNLPHGLQQEQDDQGYTILHWAAVGGCLKITETVLDSIENKEEMVNKNTNDGQNVLHLAASAGKEQLFDFLYNKYPALITGRDDNYNTIAHLAMRDGNRKILQRLINLHHERIIDLNDINGMGQTIMHIACMSGSKISLDVLVETVPDMINKIDWGGCNVFHWAAYAGNIQLIKALQNYSVESEKCVVNIQDETYTGANVLHFACLSGRGMMFQYLVNRYEHMLTSLDNERFTMAHWASVGGNVTILRFLEDSGKINLNQTSDTNLSILHAACVDSINLLKYKCSIQPQRNSIENPLSNVKMTSIKNIVVQRFLGDLERDEFSFNTLSKVLPERIIEQSFSHVSYKIRKRQLFNFIVQKYSYMLCEKDINGRNVCHLAAMAGNKVLLEKIYELMKEGNPNFTEETKEGMNVLHLACFGGDFVTFQFLLKLYPQLERKYDYNGNSVIHWAAYGGNVKIMEYLLGISPEEDFLETTSTNDTIIDLACGSGKKPMFDLLIGRFPYLLRINDGYGTGPACWAAYGGNVKIMYCLKTLHEKGATDILQTTNNGLTLLHWACLRGNLSVAEFILNSFPNFLSDTDILQRTTLHFAAFSGNIDLMSFLMKQDQERKLNLFKMKGNKGRSILDHACEGGHKAMFDLIINTYPDLINGHDDYGANAAHWAAYGGNMKIMECLHTFHKNGIIDILRTTKRRQTIIDIACNAGKLQMFRYLSNLFPELIEDNERIHAAMVWTAVGQNVHIMEELMALQEKRAENVTCDTNLILSVGQSCLYIASCNANYDMFSVVLKYFPFPDILRQRYNLPLFFEILRGIYGDGFKYSNIRMKFYSIVHFIAHGGNVRIAEALKQTVVENDFHVSDAIDPYTDVSPLADMFEIIQRFVSAPCGQLMHVFFEYFRHLHCIFEKEIKVRIESNSPENYEDEVCENPEENICIKENRKILCEHSGETIRPIASNNNAAANCFQTVTFFHENMLHIASRMSHCRMFGYLLQECPDMLVQINLFGWNIGHYAAEGKSKHIMRRLLEFHSGGKIDLSMRDFLGNTMLHIAAIAGNTSMFIYIYKHLPGLVTVKDKMGNTAAHWAAFSGYIGIIKFLLVQSTESGEVIYRRTGIPQTDIYARTNNGKNLLHCAVLGTNKVCFDFVAKQFPGMLTECDKEGKSVVHYAVQYASLEMVEYLLEGYYATRVSPRQTTSSRMTILHCAVFNEQQNVFDYVLQHFSEMLIDRDDEGKTVVHYLAQNGHADRLRSLMEGRHGSSVNLKDRTKKGMTILHLTCNGGHKRMFDYIIKKVPELLNVNDYDGRTVTYWALQGCNKGIIRKVSNHFQDLAPALD